MVIESRVCKICNLEKPLTLEYYALNPRKSKFMLHCIECKRKQFRDWYYKNHEEQKKRCAAWHEQNRERSHLQNKKWRTANREKRNEITRKSWARHREKRIKEAVSWGQKNKKARLAIAQAYRARTMNAEGRFTKEEFQQRITEQNNLCFYCGCELIVPVAEHKIPLVRGGTNYISNIVASCASCNSSKGKKTDHEFQEYRNSANKTFDLT